MLLINILYDNLNRLIPPDSIWYTSPEAAEKLVYSCDIDYKYRRWLLIWCIFINWSFYWSPKVCLSKRLTWTLKLTVHFVSM